tara:strand:+ start:11129 stop:12172 length:1044 start_codon:yes stop_codon:yes gene_type:complete
MEWFNTTQVGRLQLECTNYCNAACPQCDRADMHLSDLNNAAHTLENYKKWFSKYNWDQLTDIHFCGSVDEPSINPELIDLVQWAHTLSIQTKKISISTNGGTRDVAFWHKLGRISKKKGKLTVVFGIDGLEDTNHLYRRNVKWEILQRNFRAYIAAGGDAVWQFIVFSHNKHQLDDVKERLDREGFSKLMLIHSDREVVDEIDNERDTKFEVPDWYDTSDANKIDDVEISDIKFGDKDKKETHKSNTEISCVKCPAKTNSGDTEFHKKFGNIYVDARGYVTPCCWMGNPNEIEQLWETHKVDKNLHNLHHTNLVDIIGGYWKLIDDHLQTYFVCVRKCKQLVRDVHL